jgi:hypothetical protein
MTRSRRAIVEEEFSGIAEAICLIDLAPGCPSAFDNVDTPEEDRRHLPRLWLEAPWMRKVHPHAHLFEGNVGIEAVSGRTASFDWRPLISDRIDHVVTAPPSVG